MTLQQFSESLCLRGKRVIFLHQNEYVEPHLHFLPDWIDISFNWTRYLQYLPGVVACCSMVIPGVAAAAQCDIAPC